MPRPDDWIGRTFLIYAAFWGVTWVYAKVADAAQWRLDLRVMRSLHVNAEMEKEAHAAGVSTPIPPDCGGEWRVVDGFRQRSDYRYETCAQYREALVAWDAGLAPADRRPVPPVAAVTNWRQRLRPGDSYGETFCMYDMRAARLAAAARRE